MLWLVAACVREDGAVISSGAGGLAAGVLLGGRSAGK